MLGSHASPPTGNPHHRPGPHAPPPAPPPLPQGAAAHAALSSFTIRAREGAARCATLTTPGGSVSTPLSLLYTRRGCPPTLTPDMIQKLKPTPSAYQVNILHFLTQPGPPTLNKHGQGCRSFLALDPATLVLAGNRDPGQFEYGTKPSSDKTLYCTVPAGGRTVTPEQYIDVVAALQPDLYVTMCDEVPADSRPKTLRTSVERTRKWMDACLQLQQDRGVAALPLAAVAGGALEPERRRSAQEAAARADGVAGFALCGFGTGERPEPEPEPEAAAPVVVSEPVSAIVAGAKAPRPPAAPEPAGRRTLLRAVVSELPAGKPRFISGVCSPPEVLDAVAEGVDVFDNSYVSSVTAGGYALTFPLRQPAAGDADPTPARGAGADPSKLNLWSVSFRLDKRPLLEGCSCFTCTNHSRAYIHHLLQVHEMLADVLLEMHNTHHYLAFMAEIGAAIEGGTFGQYHAWFKGRLGPRGAWAAPAPLHVHEEAKADAAAAPEGPLGQGAGGAKRVGGADAAAEQAEGEGDEPSSKKGRWQSP